VTTAPHSTIELQQVEGFFLTKISALYVEAGGGYFGLPGVDAWDESRDARQYSGSNPVVAHPPCQRWGKF
jgi:hypothetical protein